MVVDVSIGAHRLDTFMPDGLRPDTLLDDAWRVGPEETCKSKRSQILTRVSKAGKQDIRKGEGMYLPDSPAAFFVNTR